MQRTFGPLPLQRVESGSEGPLNPVENGDLPIEAAKELTGAIVSAVLHDTRSQLKEFGDKGAVGRWTTGKENPNFARLIQSADARKAMAKALLRTVPGVEIEETFRIKGTA